MADEKDGTDNDGAAREPAAAPAAAPDDAAPPEGGAAPRPITALVDLEKVDEVRGAIAAEAERSAPPPAAVSGEIPVVGAEIGGYTLLDSDAPGWFRATAPDGADAQLHVFALAEADQAEAIEMALEAVAKVDAPEVVRPVAHGRNGEDGYWIAYPPAAGRSVASLLDDSPFPNPIAATVLAGILRALAAVHGAGLLHLALRPELVALREDGGVEVRGFGVAPAFDDEAPGVAAPAHMRAPEQLGGGDVGPATDLHAAGVLAWHMITRRSPYEQDDETAARAAVAAGERTAMFDNKHPDVPPALHRLLDALLRTSPDERPPTARDALSRISVLVARVTGRYPTMAAAFSSDPFGMLKMLASDQSRREMWRARRALAADEEDARFVAGVAYQRALTLNPLNSEAEREWRRLCRAEGFRDERAATEEVRSLEGMVAAGSREPQMYADLSAARLAAGDPIGAARALFVGALATGDDDLEARAARVFGAADDAPFDEDAHDPVALKGVEESRDEGEIVHRLPGYDDRPAAFQQDAPLPPVSDRKGELKDDSNRDDDASGAPTLRVAALAEDEGGDLGSDAPPLEDASRALADAPPKKSAAVPIAAVAVLAALAVGAWLATRGGEEPAPPAAEPDAAQVAEDEASKRRARLAREAADRAAERAAAQKAAQEERVAEAAARVEEQRQQLIDATALVNKGESAAAIAALSDIIMTDPTSDVATEARLMRAAAREQAGEIEDAILELRNVLSSVDEGHPAHARAEKQLERVESSKAESGAGKKAPPAKKAPAKKAPAKKAPAKKAPAKKAPAKKAPAKKPPPDDQPETAPEPVEAAPPPATADPAAEE